MMTFIAHFCHTWLSTGRKRTLWTHILNRYKIETNYHYWRYINSTSPRFSVIVEIKEQVCFSIEGLSSCIKNMNFSTVLRQIKQGNRFRTYLNSSFLSTLYKLHSNTKWHSSSILFKLQYRHSLCSRGVRECLPVSIRHLKMLIRN